jgi:protein tyrosine phosphatase (PTP) superfamily phosphohydrolase (DUF442 family)
MMTVESIYNYRKIDDRIATGGQPTEAQFEAIRDQGYQAVINLAPNDAENHALPNELEILSALGIDYTQIPVAWTNPTRANFQAFCSAMAELKSKKSSFIALPICASQRSTRSMPRRLRIGRKNRPTR